MFFVAACGQATTEERTAEQTTAQETVTPQTTQAETEISSSQQTIAKGEPNPNAVEEIKTSVIVTDVEDKEIGTQSAVPEAADVKIENYAFDSRAITVKAGTTVTWENYDNAPHTVTADEFDSGTLQNGKIFEHTFTEPGTYEYVCSFHPSMKGTVIVE